MDPNEVFAQKVEEQIAQVLTEMNEAWKRKPTMCADSPTLSGYMPYSVPQCCKVKLDVANGLAYFIVEEQIDHKLDDRQMRLSLYIFARDWESAKRVGEDHAYLKREGQPIMCVREITKEKIVFSTRKGQFEIELGRQKE